MLLDNNWLAFFTCTISLLYLTALSPWPQMFVRETLSKLSSWNEIWMLALRLDTSALVSNSDPYSRVFEVQKVVLGSARVMTIYRFGLAGQVLVAGEYPSRIQVTTSIYEFVRVPTSTCE